MKNNFDEFKKCIDEYLAFHGVPVDYLSNFHDTSLNNDGKVINYVYKGTKDLEVISMDELAKKSYKSIKKAREKDDIVNTVDAFLINSDNKWFFVEFKDQKVNNTNRSVLKKAYGNWYMLLDILYELKARGCGCSLFDYDDPIKFAREHVHYVLVCSKDKNLDFYNSVKNAMLKKTTYTPPYMEKLKSYLFQDAYAYTEVQFERVFVNKFIN